MSQLDDFINDSDATTDGLDNVIDLTTTHAPPSGPPVADAPPPVVGSDSELAASAAGSAPGAQLYSAPETEVLLGKLVAMIEDAKTMPLSASSMINKAEVLSVLNQATESLPDELRAARWLLKEREDFLARTQREGDELTAVARTRAEQMVQRTDLVRQAKVRARQIVDEAEAEARGMKREAEDYCDQKLASFEGVLDRTIKVVAEGRRKLQGDVLAPLAAADETPTQAARSHEFFTGEGNPTGPSPQV